MANISGKPRLGWVHPRDAAGMNAKEAALEAGAGNVSDCPPEAQSFAKERPSSMEGYSAPTGSGVGAGTTGGNYSQTVGVNAQVAPDAE